MYFVALHVRFKILDGWFNNPFFNVHFHPELDSNIWRHEAIALYSLALYMIILKSYTGCSLNIVFFP